LTVSEFAAVLRRQWLPVVVSAVLGVTIAVCLALFAVTPTYSATVKLYVSGAGANADDRLNNGEYARTHISSYADMINSNDLLQAVRDDLHLPPTQDGVLDDVADSISASNPLDTLIIDVTVKDSSPQRAQAVAAAIGQVYDPVVARLESPSDESQSPVRISVVSPPSTPIAQDSPSRKVYAAGGLLVGLAVGAGVAWLLESRGSRQRRGSGSGNSRSSRRPRRQAPRNLIDAVIGPDRLAADDDEVRRIAEARRINAEGRVGVDL
jgi:capsular polysaccharide biosynthesis protein